MLARLKASAVRKRQNYQAKRRWTLRNPERKRLHEGRLIFSELAPDELREVERLVWNVGEALRQYREAYKAER